MEGEAKVIPPRDPKVEFPEVAAIPPGMKAVVTAPQRGEELIPIPPASEIELPPPPEGPEVEPPEAPAAIPEKPQPKEGKKFKGFK
jgi:hypothetical protein